MTVSIIISTHNPEPNRLRRTLAGLRAQTLPAERWTTILIDNASASPLYAAEFAPDAPADLHVTHEPQLGLSYARRRGFAEARTPLCLLVDDDNVLAPDYLAHVVQFFAEHPRVGAIGGRSVPEFERPPEEWQREFFGLLALRDLGPAPLVSRGLRPSGATRNEYPHCAPIGAGMALRTAPAQQWAASLERPLSDRRGLELTSGGDNEIVFSLLLQGWDVAYTPDLSLTHLIPAARLGTTYLARLNRGIQQSWMQVLRKHDANPWPPLTGTGAQLRQAKAWFTYRAWRGPAEHIRWQGACGHFAGRVLPRPAREQSASLHAPGGSERVHT